MNIRKANTTGLRVYDVTGKTFGGTVVISPRQRLKRKKRDSG